MISRTIIRGLTCALRRTAQPRGLLTRTQFNFSRQIQKGNNFAQTLQEEIQAE